LTRNRYDNQFLNEIFFEIDQRRKSMRMDSVLPLTKKEKRKYVKLTSFTLVASERLRIFKLSIILFISTLKLGSLVAIDYCFFWLLVNIRYHALRVADFERQYFL
jgi:DC-STAMP-like protein